MDEWTIYASSGEHSETAESVITAAAQFMTRRPSDFVDAVVCDGMEPPLVPAASRPRAENSERQAVGTWTIYASGGEHSETAPSVIASAARFMSRRPDEFVLAVVRDGMEPALRLAENT